MILTDQQNAIVRQKIQEGAHICHAGAKWRFSKHALERMVERGKVSSLRDFDKSMKKIEKSMNKGRKIDKKQGVVVIIWYWKIVLDLHQRTIVTVFRMY